MKPLTSIERQLLIAKVAKKVDLPIQRFAGIADAKLIKAACERTPAEEAAAERERDMESEDWTEFALQMAAERIESHRDTGRWIRLAEKISTKAHRGQLRKDGSPYIDHPAHVASKVSDDLKAIAWLHDTVEDTSLSLWALELAGFPDYVIAAVDAMTKREGEDYETYLGRVCANNHARLVKIADIEHNLSGQPSEKARAKYLRALPILRAP